jgi:hypothetical protein
MSDLIGMLPPGYAPDSCRGAAQVPSPALAGLTCNEVPGVVPGGKYEVFPSVDSLNRQFDTDFRGGFFQPLACPGAPGIGPGTITGGSGWRGQLACGWLGKYTGTPTDAFGVMWTNESRSFWGRVNGTNLIGLMDWFNSVVGPS